MSVAFREVWESDHAGLVSDLELQQAVREWEKEVLAWEMTSGMPGDRGMVSPYKPRCNRR
jgi:hypothetical protein